MQNATTDQDLYISLQVDAPISDMEPVTQTQPKKKCNGQYARCRAKREG
ncbi:MAG: hypothetical protein AAF741_05195 [Bacteroidota bacterium]